MHLEFTELQNLVVWPYLNASSATRSMCMVEINILWSNIRNYRRTNSCTLLSIHKWVLQQAFFTYKVAQIWPGLICV